MYKWLIKIRDRLRDKVRRAERAQYKLGFTLTAGELVFLLEHEGPNAANARIDALEKHFNALPQEKRGHFYIGEQNAILSVQHFMRALKRGS